MWTVKQHDLPIAHLFHWIDEQYPWILTQAPCLYCWWRPVVRLHSELLVSKFLGDTHHAHGRYEPPTTTDSISLRSLMAEPQRSTPPLDTILSQFHTPPILTTISRRYSVQPALGPTQPPIQWVLGALSPVVKRPTREADHSPASSVEVKNAWSCISTLQYVFMAWYLDKHRDNLTFTCFTCLTFLISRWY